MKVAIVGAGPGGLYVAMQLRRRLAGCTVDVFEQNLEDATFGFGVALHGTSWEHVRADNEACLEDIVAHAELYYGQVVRHRGESVYFSDTQPNAGIERITLIRVLRRHALAAGVRIVHGERVTSLSALQDYDVVVGADGVNSLVRNELTDAFGTTTRTLTSRMAWYGASKRLTPARLAFKRHASGWFWCVAYPHSATHSTFVAECDHRAYEASGLDRMTEAEQAAFTEEVFADELEGASILTNKSVWRALPVVRVKHWSVGKHVLLGDALHSPHPSIGSGTRLSMGDASVLAECLAAQPNDVPAALQAYRRLREPTKAKLIEPMERSLEWYETIAERLDALTPVALMYDWLGRTGRMSSERIADIAPDFHARYGHLAPAGF